MKKNWLIFGAITLVLLIGGVFLFSKKDSAATPLPMTYEYFWGDGCPHCANVQTFFDSWEGKNKIQIEKKEVWNNPANANLMAERARYCNISPTGMGVPFLFTPEGKCFVGDTPIIDYFKNL